MSRGAVVAGGGGGRGGCAGRRGSVMAGGGGAVAAGTDCGSGGPAAGPTPSRGCRGRRRRARESCARGSRAGAARGAGRVRALPPPLHGRSSAPRRPRRAGERAQGLRLHRPPVAEAALKRRGSERGWAGGAVTPAPGLLPRRRGCRGRPVPAPRCRCCAGGERRALCRRSLRRSPQRRAGAPRPALGRRPRCERESGAAGRSMDGTVSLAPGPAAPRPGLPSGSTSRRHLPRLCPGRLRELWLRDASARALPAASGTPGRARVPGAYAAPTPTLPAGHSRAGGWQSPGGGPCAVGMPPGGAPSGGARLLPHGSPAELGAGTPRRLARRSLRSSLRARRCAGAAAHRPPSACPTACLRILGRAVVALLPRRDPAGLERQAETGSPNTHLPLPTVDCKPPREAFPQQGLTFPGETALIWNRPTCPGMASWRGGSSI